MSYCVARVTLSAALRIQVIAALHPPAVPQQLTLVEVGLSAQHAVQTLSNSNAAAGNVLTALMTLAVTAAQGSHRTAEMVRMGCIEALAERLRMSAAHHTKPKDERRQTLHMLDADKRCAPTS